MKAMSVGRFSGFTAVLWSRSEAQCDSVGEHGALHPGPHVNFQIVDVLCKQSHANVSCRNWLLFVSCSFHLDEVLDEATRKDLFTDTLSKVCGAVLQFESQRMSHYKVGWKGEFLPASTGALVGWFGVSTNVTEDFLQCVSQGLC